MMGREKTDAVPRIPKEDLRYQLVDPELEIWSRPVSAEELDTEFKPFLRRTSANRCATSAVVRSRLRPLAFPENEIVSMKERLTTIEGTLRYASLKRLERLVGTRLISFSSAAFSGQSALLGSLITASPEETRTYRSAICS